MLTQVRVIAIATILVMLVTGQSRPEPTSVAHFVMQAETELAKGQMADASKALRQFTNSLRDASREQSLIRRASYVAEQIHSRDIDNTQATFQLAELYFLENRFTDSLRVMIKIGPRGADADYYNLAGMNYAGLNDLAVASRALIKAIELAPDRPDLLVNLAGLYQRARDNRNALRALNKAVAMPSAQPQAYFALALTHFNLGNHQQSVENCARAVSRDPGFDKAYLLMGRAYSAMDKKTEARRELNRAASLNVSCDACQFELALLAVSNAESERFLRSALAINSKHSEAHFRLGKLLSEQNRIEEAVVELESAIKLAPDQDGAYYQLAMLYKKAGEQEKAQEIFGILRQRKEQRRAKSETGLTPQAQSPR